MNATSTQTCSAAKDMTTTMMTTLGSMVMLPGCHRLGRSATASAFTVLQRGLKMNRPRQTSSTRCICIQSTSSAQKSSCLPLLRTTSLRRLTAPSSLSKQFLGVRQLSSTSAIRQETNSDNAKPTSGTSPRVEEEFRVLATYEGPLAKTFTRLKLFSLGSLGLASVLTPILLLAPGEISMAGRIGLCITALATSGVSTALIAYVATPYVGSMRLLAPKSTTASTSTQTQDSTPVLELNTVSWRLKKLRTILHDPTFIRPTSRPFAAWELTNSPPPLPLPSNSMGDAVEKLVSETFDVKTNTKIGEWKVQYNPQTLTKSQTRSSDGANPDAAPQWLMQGTTQTTGKPCRYFNVHEELLGEDWQVLG